MLSPTWSTRADVALALVCCAVGQLEVAAVATDPLLMIGAALATLPVAWWRHAPFAGMVVITVAWMIVRLRTDDIGEPFFFLATLPVFYSLAVHRSAARSLTGALLMLTAVAVTTIADLTILALQFALVWLAGRGVRAYRQRSAQLRELASVLACECDATERLAVTRVRQHMAAELHDTVSHAVRLMMGQAGSAGQLLADDPHLARAALASVQDTGRRAIAELHRVLRLLRDPPHSPAPEPPAPAAVPARWSLPVPQSGWTDVLLAVLLVAAADAFLYIGDPPGRPDLVVMVVGDLLAVIVIAIRRRVPVTALALAAATTGTELLVGADAVTPAPIVATMVATYSVAAQSPARRAALATALVVISLGALLLHRVGIEGMLVMLVWLGIPVVGQRLVRADRRQAEQLSTLTTRLVDELEARTRLAVLAERARVARELHDSVAHAVSVMVLQAGAAEQVMDAAPAAADAAIRAVASQGRQAQDDLRHLLGLLTPDVTPPGVAQLDSLLSRIARAGLPVTLSISGEPVELPAELDSSAYRIVQEGLTNTLKHAGPVPATVFVGYEPDALTIEVRDPGAVEPPPPVPHGGHGLVGMRERIEHHGGTLATGPLPCGGFAVLARLPFDRVAP